MSGVSPFMSMLSTPRRHGDLYGPAHQHTDECITECIKNLPWVEDVEITHERAQSVMVTPGGLPIDDDQISARVIHSYPTGVDIEPLVREWVQTLGLPRPIVLSFMRVDPVWCR